MRRISRNFKAWGRNAKILVATEPFWSIPMGWIYFYRPIFLRESIGLSEVQIGLLFTVLTFFTVVSPLAGGYLADRFGRKRVLMSFDTVGWLSSFSVWLVTQNLWYALVAYMLEGVVSVIYSVWECILVEDTAAEHRASIYGHLSAIYNIGSLLTPVAGLIIGLYGVDAGTRLLFLFALISVIPMFVTRQLYLRETEIGSQIMKEQSFAGAKGYLSSLSLIRRSRAISALVLMYVVAAFYYAVSGYLPLYLTDQRGLALSEDLASLVPAASSISALIVASLVVTRLSSRHEYVRALTLGYGSGCLALLLLSFSPRGSLPFAMMSGVISGVYYATSFSVSRTFLANEIEVIDNRARAKVLSITITLSSLVNLPAPTLAGYLFTLEPRLPFLTVLGTLVVGLMILRVATRKGSA